MIHPTSQSALRQSSSASQSALLQPYLAAVATSFPANIVTAEETFQTLQGLFPAEDADFIRSLIQNSGVEQRHTALPPQELLCLADFTERNRVYNRIASEHALHSSKRALADAGVSADQIDVILDVSCTGIRIPALDVFLSHELHLRPDVLRIPIGESGCAAGSLALGIAHNFARNGKSVLICAVEMCTLSFIRGDVERANLIASVLFGDGSAAAVVLPPTDPRFLATETLPSTDLGRRSGPPQPRILAAGTHLFPNTEKAMGFDIGSHGLRLVLDRSLPVLLRKHLRTVIDNFLTKNNSSLEEVGLHLVHTGGRRILDIYEEVVDLEAGSLLSSRTALAKRGNISSVSILMVLEQALLDGCTAGVGKKTLGVAFGPGLSVEMFLMDNF